MLHALLCGVGLRSNALDGLVGTSLHTRAEDSWGDSGPSELQAALYEGPAAGENILRQMQSTTIAGQQFGTVSSVSDISWPMLERRCPGLVLYGGIDACFFFCLGKGEQTRVATRSHKDQGVLTIIADDTDGLEVLLWPLPVAC